MRWRHIHTLEKMEQFTIWAMHSDQMEPATTLSNSHPVTLKKTIASSFGYTYLIICNLRFSTLFFVFGIGKSVFKEAKIVATIPCRWKLSQAYYHSFGMTDNYFVFIEIPLRLNFIKAAAVNMTGSTISSCMEYYPDERVILQQPIFSLVQISLALKL